MKLGEYLKDISGKILLLIAFYALIIATLLASRTEAYVIIGILVLQIVFGVALILYDFLHKRHFYNDLINILSSLDRKYLLSEMLKEPMFLEGKILQQVLYSTNKSMNEQIARFKNDMADFRDYIELWVHEVKAPLSSLNLALRSGSRSSKTSIKAIENFIDQALFYSKIDTIDKDYVIKKVNLKNIVNEVIKNNKDLLINAKIKVSLKSLDFEVLSDPKWLRFIINQIILNSIKYCQENPEIQISAVRKESGTVLQIRDNGIGIKASEIKYVFQKGFTGSNDRRQKISTGMGLYISKKLSSDLGHQIFIWSKQGEYTKASIVFGDDDYHRLA